MYDTIFRIYDFPDTSIYYTGDAAVIEFDYFPFGDYIKIDYVFASEEYPSSSVQPSTDVDLTTFPDGTSQIFDIFGISVSQSGFHNLAFTPPTDPNNMPPKPMRWVTVKQINENNNKTYFQPNPNPPPMGSPLGTQYDGLTKTIGELGPLEAVKKGVTPCVKYKVKIAIEDFYWNSPIPEISSGFKINSALFLDEQGLESTLQATNTQFSDWNVDYYYTNTSLEGELIEDCNQIIATFRFDYPINVDFNIPFTIVSPAHRDKVEVAYDSGEIITNDSILFLAGDTVKTIVISAVNLDTDIPNVSFRYAENPCDFTNVFGGGLMGIITFNLRNNEPITFTENPKQYDAYCKETIDLTITDVTLNGVAPVYFLWENFVVPQDTFTHQVSGSPDMVEVTARDYCGNDSTIFVQINNKPIELDDILNAFLCGPGQSVTIDVNATNPDYPDYSIDHVRWYKVSPYVDLGDANGNQITVVYDDVVGNGIWECGFEITDCCGGTQTGSFVVNQSELTLGDDLWICKDETRVLSANAPAYWYNWFATNDPGTILSYTNSLTVTPDVTTEYALKILDSCNVEQTAYITVNVDLFEPQITIEPSTAEICPGETIILEANNALDYNWMPGGESTQLITLNPTTPGVYVYTLTASSEYCIDKVTTQSFEVFPDPVADFSFEPADDGCTGETIDFIYSEVVTHEIFEWNFGDGSSVSNEANPSHVYTNPGTYAVFLLVNKYICEKDTTIEININPLPAPDFDADVFSGCLPVTVDFEDLSSDVQSGAIYQWIFGDGNTSDATGNVTYTYNEKGLYTVSLSIKNTERCSETIVKNSYIQVNPNPIAGFYADPPITTMENPIIIFNDTTSSDSAIYSYQWDFGDGSGDNIKSPSHTYAMAGTYDVILIVETINGCMDTIAGQVALTEEAVLFIPNAFTPNGDGTNDTFEIKGTSIADYNLYIYDRWGNQIWSTHNFEEFWDGNDSNGNPVETGTYVYQIIGTDYLQQQVSYQGTVTVIR
jgi:gliding motility-associated-like protein